MSIEKDWYYKVTGDISTLSDCLDHFSKEAEESRKELSMKGKLEDHASKLPVISELRFTQLQILDSIIRFFEIDLKKVRTKHYKHYLESYNKVLSSRDVEKFVDGEQEVIDLELLINEIAMVRNVFTGIIKALENKSYQLNNISKLRAAGLEDSRIE